jgi:hypothetical protein
MLHSGVFPAYPYHWSELSKNNFSPTSLRAAGEISLLRKTRIQLALFARRMSWSVTANVLWSLLDSYLDGRTNLVDRELERPSENLPYFRSGPNHEIDTSKFYPWASELWANSSYQLHCLAGARGFKYFQFLQPNQHVPRSKVFSEEENRLLARENHFRQFVEKGYPYLLSKGKELKGQGVQFYDLTGPFRNENRTVYVDASAHINKWGNDIMARSVAKIISSSIGKS